jgi:Ca-activated chloride channel family protein
LNRSDNKAKLLLIAVIVFGLVIGVVSLTQNWGKSQDTVTAEASLKKLNDLFAKISVNRLTPKKDVGFQEEEAVIILPDISEYPFAVNPATADYLTVYAAAEIAGSDQGNWLVEEAEAFNRSGVIVDGKPVSVGVRVIPSALSADFISSNKYKPDVLIASNMLWGNILISKGVKAVELEERLAGNTAGMVIYSKKFDELTGKYGELNIKTIVSCVLNGEIALGYTNPLSSSEGLNLLLSVLHVFDVNEPLGTASVTQLRKFQDNIPYVSYDVAQLKSSALNGTLDGFVSDYFTYVNAPDLKSSYTFIPFGVRHDHPAYEIGDLVPMKKQMALLFMEHLKKPDAQAAAAGKGLNSLEAYQSDYPQPDGTTLIQAQETWKKEKNGSSDLTAVFVADISGSMEGSPLLKLKASLNRAVSVIDMNTNIGLVTFSDSVNIALPIAKFDFEQKAYFSNAVRSMTAGGGTAMYDAIVVAQKMLIDAQERNPNTKLMLFVLTDGETNRGLSFEDIEVMTRGLKIPVYTIGYNADIDSLRRLSDINEATTMNAETEDVIYKLQSLFNAQM